MKVVAVAKHVNVMLVDDLDGSAAQETVSFGLDGRQYDVDLSAANGTPWRLSWRWPAAGTDGSVSVRSV
jgi:Lsr2